MKPGLFKSRKERSRREREDEDDPQDDEEEERPRKRAQRGDDMRGEKKPPSDLFSGVEDAKASGDWNYELPGTYIERIDSVKLKQSRKRRWYLVFEKTILKVIDDNDGAGHRPGDVVTHMIDTSSDYFLGEIKGILSRILKVDADEVGQEECEAITRKAQPLRGIIVQCTNVNRVTKSDKDFTKIKYERVAAARLPKLLGEKAVDRFFPDDQLDALIESEADLGLGMDDDDEKPSSKARGRSRARDEDEAEEEDEKPSSKARGRSRARDEDDEPEEVEDEEEERPVRRTKAKSRRIAEDDD